MLKPSSLPKVGILFLVAILWQMPHFTYAQGYTNYHWIFGSNSNSIRFTRSQNPEPILMDNATGLGENGAAVASDPVTGRLLFYTDGHTIYNRNHDIMADGINDALNTTSRQPVIITPVPGTENQYYVLSKDINGEVTYSLIDMSLNMDGRFPLGDVIETNQPTGITNLAQAWKPLPQGNEQVILVQDQNNDLIIYEVGDDGTFTPSFTLPIGIEAAAFSFHQASGRLAIIPASPNEDIVLLNYNPDTGELTNNGDTIPGSGAIGETIFDGEWSADGLKFYFSRYSQVGGPTGGLYQYDLDEETDAGISRVFPENFAGSFGLRRGPDGNIYHIYQENDGGPYQIGRVLQADSLAPAMTYEPALFDGANFGARVFPHAAPPPNFDTDINFTYQGACANVPTKFIPEVNPNPDSLSWDFGNGDSSTSFAPLYTYEQGGSFDVTLSAFFGGIQRDTTITITITPFDLSISVQDSTACEFPIELEAQVEGGSGQITWFDGSSGQSASIPRQGTYWAMVSDGACTAHTTFVARLYGDTSRVANIWYFGNNAGIDFNEQPPIALGDGTMSAPEGTATISDPNGDLLFYTDGSTVWNRDHQIMDNGTDIGGSPEASQSSLIVPFPDDETMFYIFTTESGGSAGNYLSYSIVDMKANGGIGQVVEKGNRLFTPITEKLTATPPNGQSWLITHEIGTNTFRTYPVTDQGIGNPVLSSVGSVHNEAQAKGYMKLSNDNERLAVTVAPDRVELFTFTDTTGVISDPIVLDVPGTVYGLDFSPGNNKLYVSTQGPSGIYEFFIDTTDVAYIQQSRTLLSGSNVAENLGAIQRGPDGQIYVAREGSNFLSTIIPSESEDQASTFIADGFQLAPGTTSTLGLPNFVQTLMNPPTQPSMAVTGGCAGTESTFSGAGTSDIDQFRWTVIRESDGQQVFASSDQETEFIFDQPGFYDVSLRVFNECGFDTLMFETIEIFPNPDLSAIERYAVLCGESVTLEGPEAEAGITLTYSWINPTGVEVGTERALEATEEGIYVLIVTNQHGCSDEVDITVAPPFEMDLGEDQSVCQDEELMLDSGVNADNYIWTVTDGDGNTTNLPNQRRAVVDTSNPGTFTYRVEVEDPIADGCFVVDEVTIIVHPFATAYELEEPACGDADGEITLDITGNGPYSITWSGLPAFANQITATGLEAGNYNVTITDDATGCSETLNIGLENSGTDFDILGEPSCSNGRPTIQVRFFTPPPSGTYEVFDQDGNTIIGPSNFTDSELDENNIFFISEDEGLTETGSYSVVITDNNGCIQTVNVEIGQMQIFTDTDVTGCNEARLEAVSIPANGTFTWTGPGTPIGPTSSSVITVTQTDTYTVEVEADGYCPADATINVTLLPEPQVGIAVNNDMICDGSATLTAQPLDPGDYSYLWSNNATGEEITVNQSGDYHVTIRRNDNLNCYSQSQPETVVVPQDFNVTIASDPVCDESPIALNAEISPNNQTYTYAWFRGGEALGNSQTVTATQDGNYRLEVSVNVNGIVCPPREATRLVERPGEFIPSLDEEYFICPADPASNTVILDAGGPYQAYLWDNNETGRVRTVTEPGNYSVVVTRMGCEYNEQTVVTDNCTPLVWVPNAFRPASNNPQNKAFIVVANEYATELQLIIYNRWGELIFYTEGEKVTTVGWDGRTRNGTEAPAGGYAYVVRYKGINTLDQPYQQIKGGVTLIR
jgi:large repetitive protein